MTTFNSSRFTELAGLLLEDSSRKYLEKINFDSLIKAAGKPTGDPKSFYREIQSKSKSGPIFSEKVIGFVDNLPQELQKNEAKWLANLLQKDDSLGAFNLASSSISNIIDWVRAENPNLENYNLQMTNEEQQKWHERFKVQAANNDIKTVNDTDVVFKCSDGYVFVKLVSKQDCAEEGKHMQHCVETYWRKIKSNKCSIFSLRDQQNDPHATIEYNPGYKTIVQIKGKQNKSPIKKYTKYIKEFIAFLKPEITQTLFPYLPFAQVSAYIEDLTSYEVSQIAENESTPIEILSFLSKNEDPYVRAGVVLNSNTPINTVLLLANDEEEVGNSPSQTIGGDTVGEIAKKVLLNRKPKTEEATVNFECLKRLIRNVITEVMSK